MQIWLQSITIIAIRHNIIKLSSMKLYLATLTFILLLSSSTSLQLHQADASTSSKIHPLSASETMVGGYSPINITHLTPEQQNIDTFIKSQKPELKDAKLVSAEQQVVAGMNYRYTYCKKDQKGNQQTWTVVVYRNLQGINTITSFAPSKATNSSPSNSKQNVQTKVGGYEAINLKNMTKEQKSIDSFIRAKYPELKNAKLVSGQQQVVAGMNYKYTYAQGASKKWVFVVYHNLKGHNEITSLAKSDEKQSKKSQAFSQVKLTSNTGIHRSKL